MLGFDNIPERKGYLRQAGVQQNAKFLGLVYTANEQWEGLDIEIECEDGRYFRERTFGPDIDKVYPKAKYENGVKVGEETKQEALDRVNDEITKKLFYLAACFVNTATLKEKVKNCKDLKDLVDKVNKAIGDTENLPKINFLTIWKNSDSKMRSNLILAERIKWCEPTKHTSEGVSMPATIALSNWQVQNCMEEKYPYQGGNSTEAHAPVSTEAGNSDLPF